MFESIGRHRDEDARWRQAQALGLAGAGFSSAILVVTLLLVLVPRSSEAPLLEPIPGEIGDEQWARVDLGAPGEAGDGEEAPPPAPPPVLETPEPPAVAEPDDWEPAVRPLDTRPSTTVRSAPSHQPTSGSGTGEGTGSGGTCKGTDCSGDGNGGGGGGGDGARVLHHTQLERLGGEDPLFPAAARKAGFQEARCLASLAIDRQGRVYAVQIDEDCPPVFHRSVERALRTWTFRPQRTDAGDTVEARTRIAVRFRR